MKNVTISYSEEARKELLAGVEKIAKAVKGTLGPSGKNVLIRGHNGDNKPFATKDGVTVASTIYSKNPNEQIAIELIQDAANNADNKAGDGTTTTTILAEAIFKLGTKATASDTNVLDLKLGIDLAVKEVIKYLTKISVKCHEDYKRLLEVALISSNNDKQIAQVVLDAFKVSGNQGVVNIKRSRTNETYLSTIKGMNISTGYRSPYYVNDHANDLVEFKNPYIYITNERISSITENFDTLLQTIMTKKKSLLIISKDIDPAVQGMLIDNIKNGLQVCVCKAPGFGEQQNETLRDIGTMLGFNPFLENDGNDFNELKVSIKKDPATNQFIDSDILKNFPQSEAIMATKNMLSIKGPVGITKKREKEIEKGKLTKADQLRSLLEKQKTSYEKAELQSRISKLTDGIAFIHIGAISDIEYEDKQHRIQDTLYAVKSASEEGIVAGGGTALLHASTIHITAKNRFIQLGIGVVMDAISEPFKQILRNVGIKVSPTQIKYFKDNYNFGINARTGEHSDDMIGIGIIDPLKVTRIALENAASISGMLLTTDCVVIDTSVYDEPTNPNY